LLSLEIVWEQLVIPEQISLDRSPRLSMRMTSRIASAVLANDDVARHAAMVDLASRSTTHGAAALMG